MEAPRVAGLQEQLDEYARTGYQVVPGALSGDQVDAINAAIDRDLAASTPFWLEREHGQVALSVYALLAHEALDVTMRPPSLLPLLEGILGPELCAEEHSVRIRRPHDGEPYCHWHRDGGGRPSLARRGPFYTAYVSVAYYLSDVDASTHTFSVIPGSAQGEALADLDSYDLSTAITSRAAGGPPSCSTPACSTAATCAAPATSGARSTSTAAAAATRR